MTDPIVVERHIRFDRSQVGDSLTILPADIGDGLVDDITMFCERSDAGGYFVSLKALSRFYFIPTAVSVIEKVLSRLDQSESEYSVSLCKELSLIHI